MGKFIRISMKVNKRRDTRKRPFCVEQRRTGHAVYSTEGELARFPLTIAAVAKSCTLSISHVSYSAKAHILVMQKNVYCPHRALLATLSE